MFESDDLVPVLVEAVVRSIWLALVAAWTLSLFTFRNAVMAGIVLALTVVGLHEGWTAAALLSAGGVSIFVAWRVLHPTSFNQVAAPRLHQVWRGAYYRARWPRVASRNGLVAHDSDFGRTHRRGEVPRIRKLVVTPQRSRSPELAPPGRADAIRHRGPVRRYRSCPRLRRVAGGRGPTRKSLA